MKYLFYFFLFFCPITLSGQLLLNEICSDNASIIADEEGEFEDWIELYNASSSTVNLEGYWLSDDEDTPNKWSFPTIEIPAGGFLLIFASSKDFLGQDPHTNFKISKDGETILLSNPQLEMIDLIVIPALNEDQSYGRQPDGSNNLFYFSNPSPQQSNNSSTTFNFANPPAFSNTTFFYSQSNSVEIDCDHPDCIIYYTTDGNVPDENSLLYSGAITLDTTTTIRAASVTPSLLLSKPRSRTFFINEEHELPVMSLTTTPENLWDFETGIFVDGPNADTIFPFFGANFWSDREIPMHLEFFENEDLKVEYSLAARIHGGKGARTKAMKPLRFLAKGSFGTSLIDYPFFDNRTNTKFERLVLRNASGDFNVCHMRDEFLARYFINEGLEADGITERPLVVYINGVYWGVMHLREKFDRFYLQYNYGVDPDNVDILEEDTLIVDGSFNIFNTHEAFVLNNNLEDQSNFETASQYFDTKNLMDYVIGQTFVNNTDWPRNNSKYWRERTASAKWRYVIFDMDVAMAFQGFTKASINSFGDKMAINDVRVINIFKSFLENENFRNDFINRYLDLLNSSFSTETFRAEVIKSRDELDFEMQRHVPRWGKNYDNWYNNEIPKLIKFADERPPYARQYLGEFFGVNSEDRISVSAFPNAAGSIQLNTLSLDSSQFPWEGIYFNQVPIQMTVIPESGFIFSHWESNRSTTPISNNLSIEVQPRTGERFTAIFENENTEPSLTVFPNPVSDVLNFNLLSSSPGKVEIKIFDSIGRLLVSLEDYVSTGENQFNLDIKHLEQGTFFIHVIGNDYCISQKFVRVKNP